MSKRRGAGEGSVYRRQADGRWAGAISLEPVEGKRQRKIVYGKTRAEVRKKMAEVQRQLDAGVSVANYRLLVGDYLNRWIHTNVPGSISDTTLADYQDLVSRHLTPAIGHSD